MAREKLFLTKEEPKIKAVELIEVLKNSNISLDQKLVQVRKLIDDGADILARDEMGYNAFLHSLYFRYEEIAELILNYVRGTNIAKIIITTCDNMGCSPLMLAIDRKYIQIIDLIFNIAENENILNDVITHRDHWGRMPLLCASHEGLIQIVKKIINIAREEGYLKNMLIHQDQNKNLILLYPIYKNHIDILELLLKTSREVGILKEVINVKNTNGFTIFHVAALISNEKIMNMLIDYGCNASVLDIAGETPADKIIDDVLKEKFKKFEKTYVKVKIIIQKIIDKKPLTMEEKSLFKNFDKCEKFERENISKSVYNIVKLEIEDSILKDDYDSAMNLTDFVNSIFFDYDIKEKLLLYQIMISRFYQIKGWEFGKFYSSKEILPNHVLKIIGKFLNLEDISTFSNPSSKTKLIYDFKIAMNKFDFPITTGIYEEIEQVWNKFVQFNFFKMKSRHKNFSQDLALEDGDHKSESEAEKLHDSDSSFIDGQNDDVEVAGAGAGSA